MSEAFTQMYRGEFGYVWKVLARLGAQENHREDLAHDVFATAFRHLGDYDPARPVRPWLFGIAFRVMLDFKRKGQNRNEAAVEAPELADESASAEDALAASQGIPLPRQIKLLVPAATVPAKWTEYLGAWGGDKRWNRGGRQVILVIESIDEAGTALGVYAHGLPLAGTPANQAPARFGAFTGTISDKGLTFPWAKATLTFILMAWMRRAS